MNELFGLDMTTIMFVLLGLFLVCAVAAGSSALLNRTMFRMGLRNVRRRRANSILVVSGLMLATIIITASFATGDTLDYSITTTTYDTLQRTDLSLHHFQPSDAAATGQFYANEDVGQRLGNAFANDPDIEGFVPFLFEPVPAIDTRTNLAEPAVVLAGVDGPALAPFGGLHFTSGKAADVATLAEDEVFANERAVDKMDIRAGDTINVFVGGQPVALRVAGIVRDERASGTLEFGGGGALPGLATRLATVQRITGRTGLVNSVSVVLHGGIRGSLARSEPAALRLEALIASPAGKQELGTAAFQVERIKDDAVDAAELAGNTFTAMFLVLGLFSIASGVLLIFMIFVMLAAERRQEMGIARAVGAERRHLVQAFLAEGGTYDLVAGVFGVGLGVVVAFVVVIGGFRLIVGDAATFVEPHVTVRTIVVSFCLGAVLTFITVVASSFYVSRLNIVAAIRGQVESGRARQGRARFSWRWLVAGLLALVAPPLGLYWILAKAFGLPRTWVFVPMGVLFGIFLLWLGRATDSSFFFSTGISLLPLTVAVLLRHFGVNGRVVWTGFGFALCLYWLMPLNVSESLFGSFDNSGMEMFVLSGIMIVTGLTLIIVFNSPVISAIYAGASRGRSGYRVAGGLLAATLLVGLAGFFLRDTGGGVGDIALGFAIVLGVAAVFSASAQRFQGLAPALKMGIAYPIANRFRTSMAIAMFSLILFSLTVMSVINASFLQIFAGDEARASWDLLVDTNKNNPIADLAGALRAGGSATADQVVAVGRLTPVDDDRQRVRQPGHASWDRLIVRAADDAFWTAMQAKLESRAHGYESDRAVYDAMMSRPDVAVVDATVLLNNDFGNPDMFQAEGITISDDRFDPFPIEVRDEATGQVRTVSVIGVLSSRIPSGILPGLMISRSTSEALFGASELRTLMVRLQPGVDSGRAAKDVKATLVTQGVNAFSIKKEIDDALALSRNILRLLQVFMGLGLVVGIAAIGVISLRSVVERRQQIGMLRAIGYERSTVALSFLLETTFVALMGVGSGVLGAIILSRNLVTSADFTGTAGIDLYVPWPEVIGFSVLAFVFALLMTWWPSRRAASVPIAEALRYE